MRHDRKSGTKAPSTRNGDIAEITKAVKAACDRKFGKYVHPDRKRKSLVNK